MFLTPSAIAPLLFIAVDLTAPTSTAPGTPIDPAQAATPPVLAGQRQRRGAGSPKRGTHELEDPSGWPAEPPFPAGPLDADRFDAAVVRLCGEVAPESGLPEVARVIRQVSLDANADPFLIAAVAYRESRCRPGLSGASGVGLLQIQPAMFAPHAPLPFPRSVLDRDNLLDPEENVRAGIALLRMWESDHLAIDRALGSTPHRTAVAHLYWGDRVWGTTSEDRTFTARRRLLEMYANQPIAPRPSSFQFVSIVPPLEGTPRLATSGLGDDREGGERAHRGLDIDATVGEPVRAVADGVVQFAGADLPGDKPARDLLPRQLRRWRYKNLGPGGFFVRVTHAGGVRTGYFHLNSYCVVIGQAVRAGEIIGTVGRTGVKVSGSHLHFETHRDGELENPVPFLADFVLPPERTITHQLAVAEKRERLARVYRARRHARLAARHLT